MNRVPTIGLASTSLLPDQLATIGISMIANPNRNSG